MVDGSLDVVDLTATLDHRLEVLGAPLDPAHRLTQLDRKLGGQDLFGVGLELGAEAATHVRRDDAHAILRQAQ